MGVKGHKGGASHRPVMKADLPQRPVPPPPRAKYPVGGFGSEKKWVKLDAAGRTSIIAMDRHRLTQELGVQLRDLRLLDPKFATSYPSAILCRDRALVVNLEHIKAILTPGYVLVMNPSGDGVVPFVKDLEQRLCQTSMPSSASFPVLTEAAKNFKKHSQNQGDMQSMPAGGLINGGEGLHLTPSTPLLFHPQSSDCVGNEGGGGNLPPDLCRQQQRNGDGLPFELKALEVCLESICSTLDELTTELEATAFPALDALTFKVNTHNLQRVRSIKSKMVRLTKRVETVREVLEKFLEDDSDMRSMNLTAKQQNQRNSLDLRHGSKVEGGECDVVASVSDWSTASEDEDLQEVEMLLEAYFMQLDNTMNRLHTLCNYTDDTEDYVNIQQDKHRNQLLQLELLITAGTFALAFVAVITGIFGMNLRSDLEESKTTFLLVSTLTTSGAVGVLIVLIIFCRWKGLMFN